MRCALHGVTKYSRVNPLRPPLDHCQVSACATSLKELATTEEGGGAGEPERERGKGVKGMGESREGGSWLD